MRALAVVLLLAALAACNGGAGSDTPGDRGGMPACSDVWAEGKALPRDYEGCMANGSIQAAVTFDCTDGSEFTGYQDRYWAVLGGKIKDSGKENGTDDDPRYAKDYAACTAD